MEGAATMTAEERLVETVGRVLPDYWRRRRHAELLRQAGAVLLALLVLAVIYGLLAVTP
jgi:hypothetical protein